jgi:hypothetical protein
VQKDLLALLSDRPRGFLGMNLTFHSILQDNLDRLGDETSMVDLKEPKYDFCLPSGSISILNTGEAICNPNDDAILTER